MAAAGIATDWPHGRGCYISEDKGMVIWVGGKDHLRIICRHTGLVLNDVYERLRATLLELTAPDMLEFAVSPRVGVVTSSPVCHITVCAPILYEPA